MEITLNSYTTMVDVKKCKMYIRNFGEFFNNQVEYAGAIILSRTDLVDEEKAQQCMELLRSINPKAAIITTPIENLTGKKILEVMENPVSLEQELLEEEVCPECGHIHGHDHHHDHEHGPHHEHDHHHDHEHGPHHEHDHHHDHEHGSHHEHDHHHDHEHGPHHEHDHHHDHEHGPHHDHDGHHDHHHGHHHADEIFTSWGRETTKKFEKEEIEKKLEILSASEEFGMILRAKGMLSDSQGEWTYFDMVPGEVEIRTGAPDYTGRICVIGSKLKEEKLAELFGV